MKAGRGKGKKGGSGMAGLHKHRWVWTIKNDPLHFGGKGFTSHHRGVLDIPITLSELDDNLDRLRKQGYVTEEGGGLIIDLRSAGFTKLLGSGNFDVKSSIKIDKITEKALNKLSVAGITVETNDGHSKE
ncbi:MAG: 50S ribosomal protein L15 [Thermoplasmatales archaeon]|nr:50S ribosomal protein L15 [Thermoplasmatales archaeon]MCW6170551.1 50S ribosomal protein L15 [Thermoplasmatales archaeon]